MIDNNEHEILLLGFNQTHYGICKNFKDEQFEVTAASRDSNYLKKSCLPDFYIKSFEETDVELFLNTLIELGEKSPQKYFLVPGTDTEVDFLVTYRDKLEPYFFISAPNRDKYELVTDKFLIQDLLIQSDFKYPKTILMSDVDEIAHAVLNIGFPCIVKPAFAGDWKKPASSGVIGEHKVFIVHDSEELKTLWEKVRSVSSRLIAQTIIKPAEGGIYSFCSYSDCNGKVLHAFVTQKLIQYPDGFGTALLCQTVEELDVYEFGKKIIETLGVDGVCETEIIRDACTGELYVIEINTRHWMQHRLSTRLGVNYSILDFYYRMGNEQKVYEILQNSSHQSCNFIWFDDVGYLIYSIKNVFDPSKYRFKDVWCNKWEFSLFSLSDWRPFVGCVRQKLSL